MWRMEGNELSYVKSPAYAWNELIAEQLLFDGAAAYTDYDAFYPLMAAVFAAQMTEVKIRHQIATERISEPKRAYEQKAGIEVCVLRPLS